MRKNLVKIVLAAVVAFFGAVAPATTVWAENNDEPTTTSGFKDICDGELAGSDVCQPVSDNRNLMVVIQGVINVALSIIGIITVIVIIVAGQRMVTSAGDPGKLKAAKDMLTWGIIGMVVALLAYVIINFVVGIVPAG